MGLPKSKIRNLTKLRISAHKLQIKIGRYARPKIQRQNRLCSSCNVLEDELHFILYCKNNQSERSQLFNDLQYTININDNDSTSAKHLLNPKTKQECSLICTFIENTMNC